MNADANLLIDCHLIWLISASLQLLGIAQLCAKYTFVS